MKFLRSLTIVFLLAFIVQPVMPAAAGGSSAGIYESSVGDKYISAGFTDQVIMSFTIEPWAGIPGDLTIEGLDLTCAPSHGFTTVKLMNNAREVAQTTFGPGEVAGTQHAHFGANNYILPNGIATDLSLRITVDANTGSYMTACAIDEIRLRNTWTGRVFGSESQAINFGGMDTLIYVNDINAPYSGASFVVSTGRYQPELFEPGSKNNLLMTAAVTFDKGVALKDVFFVCDNGDVIKDYRLVIDGKTFDYTAMQNNWSTNSRPEHSTVDRIVFANVDAFIPAGAMIQLYGDAYNYFSHFLGDETQCSIIDIKNSSLSLADEVTLTEKSLVTTPSQVLTDQLLGHILLQVETYGQAWYLDPVSRLKYYLPNGVVAYDALREFGLGVTNVDLSKIPVGIEDRFEAADTDGDGLADRLEEGLKTSVHNPDTDGDGIDDRTEVLNGHNPLGSGDLAFDDNLTSRLQGRILLQVESRGEAWYVNPMDGKRYYMKNGDAAYQIMRFLSLGITNENIRKISVGTM